MSLRLTQGDENQRQIEWHRRVFLALPQRIGCPILRAFCEGWDKQTLRGRASGEEQWHPILRKKTRRMGHPILCGRARNTVFDCAANSAAIPGFSRWGRPFLSSEFTYAPMKLPSRLKPGSSRCPLHRRYGNSAIVLVRSVSIDVSAAVKAGALAVKRMAPGVLELRTTTNARPLKSAR